VSEGRKARLRKKDLNETINHRRKTMAQITLKGNPILTIGNLPTVNMPAPAFSLTKTDLSECSLKDFKDKTVILNIFPSIDTPVCAASVRRFNEEASSLNNTVVLCISADLPFAHKRFCEGDGLKNVIPLSSFRAQSFGTEYGVTITTGPLAGLLARAIIIVDKNGSVIHTELVPEIAQEPDYSKALRCLSN
jgi:thioredoxin-dependent peroxiredoxin